MSSSVTDAINLAASIITLLGAGATLVGFIRKLMSPAPRSLPPASPSNPPANAPYGGHTFSGSRPGARPTAPVVGAPAPVSAPRIPHPIILTFSAIASLCVVGYSLVLLTQFVQTGSTGIPNGSPLIVVNAILIAGNLICGCAAEIGLIISASRAQATGWLVGGVIGLAVIVFTLGIFSIVALVPTIFYSLFGSNVRQSSR